MQVTPLAWHDMFAHSPASDLQLFRLPELLEPVLWSYAEDLNSFLPYNTWEALAVRTLFGLGSSVFLSRALRVKKIIIIINDFEAKLLIRNGKVIVIVMICYS